MAKKAKTIRNNCNLTTYSSRHKGYWAGNNHANNNFAQGIPILIGVNEVDTDLDPVKEGRNLYLNMVAHSAKSWFQEGPWHASRIKLTKRALRCN